MMRVGKMTFEKLFKVFPKVDYERVAKEYERNENNNAHSENLVLLAETFGNNKDYELATTIVKRRNAEGSFPNDLYDAAKEMSDRLYPKYKEAKKNLQKEKQGMAKDGEVKDSKIIRKALEDGHFRIQGVAINRNGKSESQFTSEVENEIKLLLKDHLFDADFYHGWLESEDKKEYKDYFNNVLSPNIMSDIDSFFDEYMEFGKFIGSIYPEWKYKKGYSVRDSIMKSDTLSKGVKESYRKYRREYAYEVFMSGGVMAKGGATFAEKVSAIKSKLKGTKVPSKLKKDYGKNYSSKEAEMAAKRIAGAMRKKEM
jgi:hypothetical protein